MYYNYQFTRWHILFLALLSFVLTIHYSRLILSAKNPNLVFGVLVPIAYLTIICVPSVSYI